MASYVTSTLTTGRALQPIGAEGAAADLAGVVAQRFADELEGARDLVAHEPLAEERAQLVLVDRRAVVGLDDRVQASCRGRRRAGR